MKWFDILIVTLLMQQVNVLAQELQDQKVHNVPSKTQQIPQILSGNDETKVSVPNSSEPASADDQTKVKPSEQKPPQEHNIEIDNSPISSPADETQQIKLDKPVIQDEAPKDKQLHHEIEINQHSDKDNYQKPFEPESSPVSANQTPQLQDSENSHGIDQVQEGKNDRAGQDIPDRIVDHSKTKLQSKPNRKSQDKPQGQTNLAKEIMENAWLEDGFSNEVNASDLVRPNVLEDRKAADKKKAELKSEKSQQEVDKKSDKTDQAKDKKSQQKQKENDLARKVFAISVDDIVLGNARSKVIVLEYTSLTCPHCAHYHSSVYKKIKEKYIDTSKIGYVVRNVVWTPQDLDSSILARCDKNKFLAFANILYSRQRSWIFARNYKDILTSIGQLGGISPEMYSQCLSDDKLKDSLILKTKQFAEVLGSKLVPTPAIIVNGKMVAQHSFEEVSRAIEEALKSNG